MDIIKLYCLGFNAISEMFKNTIKKIFDWCLSKIIGIEPNISNLKSNFDKNKVIVQYTPPKGLSPSEVGMIYYRNYKASNINCMIYKRASEGIISFEDKGNKGHIKLLKKLDNSVPGYELSYWKGLLMYKRVHIGGDVYEIIDPENLMFGLSRIQGELLDYCIGKGWLKRTGKINYSNDTKLLLVMLFSAFLVLGYPILAIKFINIINSFQLLFIGWFAVMAFAGWRIGVKIDELQCPTDIKLTEEGNKLFTEIYGYKYFLEHCEEEKLKMLIEENPNYINETLPYAVALRLNVKFLKYSISNFSMVSLYVYPNNFKDSDDSNNPSFTVKQL